MRTADPDPGYTHIRFDGKDNWVRLKPAAVSRGFETYRYAALAGGTLAFTKMEGTTVNARDKIAYTAMAHIGRPSTAMSPHLRRLTRARSINCTCKAQSDTDGVAIDSDWVPVDMAAVLNWWARCWPR